MRRTREERRDLAQKRVCSVLGRHGIACARTIENKISDAGPLNQRIDPHILTEVRNSLVKDGTLTESSHAGVPWYSLGNTEPGVVTARLAEQLPVYRAFTHGSLTVRTGQALEIATFRALSASTRPFFGGFPDLANHDDGTLYTKHEPPQNLGNRWLPGDLRLDFLVSSGADYLGIECKNVREWLYPYREDVLPTLRKCLLLDCVPVLICRRYPYVTFRLLGACGVILHQCFGQILPASAAAVAQQARNKHLLGYHDIRVGNEPDSRLRRFLANSIHAAAPQARARFDANKDLLQGFAFGDMNYEEFAGRLGRRERGENEDGEWAEVEETDDPPY